MRPKAGRGTEQIARSEFLIRRAFTRGNLLERVRVTIIGRRAMIDGDDCDSIHSHSIHSQD